MKQFLRLLNQSWMILLVLSLGFFASCSKDDDTEDPVAPAASFQFEVNAENTLEVAFTNYSQNATSYTWDFGNNVGVSNEESPTYTYTAGGTYTVTLIATGAGGTAEHTKEVVVIDPSGENMIKNGEFDDESEWSIIQHHTSNNGIVTIANGVAVFDEIIDVPSGDWGNEAHVGINQMLVVEAGSYQLDLDITTNGIDECWFEVWVGLDAPIDGEDYNEEDNATKVLSFNAWDCGDINKVYSGPMAAASCQDTDGTITLEAGTYYVVIRSGGFTFGEGGIIIDNVSMLKI